jgi:hypothetical protein
LKPAFFLCLLLYACPVAAQDRGTDAAVMTSGEWSPVGVVPVDQAGAGRRGYVLAGEGTDVAAPGAVDLSIHFVAANNFYREQNDSFSISQRFETHTGAFGFRRGFKSGGGRRWEIGGQVQLTEADGGFMNGFITRTEDFLAWMSGQQSAVNALRRSTELRPPLGTTVTRNGIPLYQEAARSGLGDISVTAKALLRDAEPWSRRTRVAVRLGINIAATSALTAGNFIGTGLSVDKKVLAKLALHGDVRTHVFLERQSAWNLPLARGSVAFSAGPELQLTRNSSASVQMDGSTTPYQHAGATALDKGDGDVTFGFNHPSGTDRRQVIAQVDLRENMNLPFRVRWNTDPDLSVGVKVMIRGASR